MTTGGYLFSIGWIPFLGLSAVAGYSRGELTGWWLCTVIWLMLGIFVIKTCDYFDSRQA